MKADSDSATDDVDVEDTKKDEPMPVEDDLILETVDKSDESIAETDIDVHSVNENYGIASECTVKSDESLPDDVPLNKSDELGTATMGLVEPMECASVHSMPSPKHIITTDEIMLESVSV